ncbi:MAG: hypothetical protein PHN88_13115 [Ignavibacteria bacterium]|nr:hypothetical protein [Ignavibacteria bacterium]
MNKKIVLIITFLVLLVFTDTFAKPRIEFQNGNPRVQYSPNIIQTQTRFDPNNISTWIQNTGIFNQDIRTSNTPGFMWPKGSNKFAIFTSGLTIGAHIGGQLRLASNSYKGEYEPGYVSLSGGVSTPMTNPDFKVYKVTSDDSTSADYSNWYKMIPYGAPYIDVNNNGQFDQGIDRPGIKSATMTVFLCMTDGFPETHNQSEGFSGGTAPMYSEMHLTAWGYGEDGLNDIQFLSFAVINKNSQDWDDTHFGFVVDPDLGNGNDDYIGCDTAKNLAYVYNSSNMDGTGASPSYGLNPPSAGMDFFLSPMEYTGNPSDVVVYYDPPGSKNKVTKVGYRQLGMTSFVYFTNNSSGDIVCEQDPSLPQEAFNFLHGIKKDGSYWFDPTISPHPRTNKLYPGEPEGEKGWTEFGFNGNATLARVKNCTGGDTVATYVSPPGDRRFIFNSGKDGYTVHSGDTQRVVLAQLVARGTNNKNAVTRLKRLDITAQALFDFNFQKPPDIPLPATNFSVIDKGTGKCSIMLSWDDRAESYYTWDSLGQPKTDTSYWKFEGYEVYQIKDINGAIPDFYQPETMNDNIKLLKIYDIVDSIGYIMDTITNVAGGFTAIPVVPPYLQPVPEGFPQSGINRSILLDATAFPDVQNNESKFVYGRTYYFAVVAYAYKTHALLGARMVKRNSISINTIKVVRPESPLQGTVYSYKNTDTISTNRRDLGVMPIVVNQNALVDAKYRILFKNVNPLGNPDTTYSILKSIDGGQTYDTVKKYLKFTSNNSQDSSRIIDGILINVKKIKSVDALGLPRNWGVIKDPISGAMNWDSIQSRYRGWDYLRNNNPVDIFTGSSYTPSLPYQSKSMSLTFPATGTFNNIKSQLKPEQLRKVKIIFSDLNNGQYAYRYRNTGSYFTYKDSVKVPFNVWMVDSITNDLRQLNCAIVVDTAGSGNFTPTADSLGGKLLVYVFNSTYDGAATASYKTKNLYISTSIDVMYIWAPKLINSNLTYASGDVLNIYPYTVTRPFFSGTTPLWYDFETKASQYSVTQAKTDMNLIRVVPNPYYGYNDLETSSTYRFVTFRHLPAKCTIKLYSLDGSLVRTLNKNDNNSTLNWDLKNVESVPIASGLYIALIDVPNVGQKIMKLAIFTAEERIDVR